MQANAPSWFSGRKALGFPVLTNHFHSRYKGMKPDGKMVVKHLSFMQPLLRPLLLNLANLVSVS